MRYPTSARVGIVTASCAVEVTTVLQFDHIPQNPWFLYFPTSTANGRLVETAVLHHRLEVEPKLAFFKPQQTVVIGPCVPEQSTLIFTIVTVYVPSYRQSFILHMHMGTLNYPCQASVSLRNLVAGGIHAQLRGYNGQILGMLHDDKTVSTATLRDSNNCKLHIYLEGCFGVTQPFWVTDGTQTWLFSLTAERMTQPTMWILKPPARDITVVSFFVTNISRGPRTVSSGEPQELLVIAASIISGKIESFFVEGTPCITEDSEEHLLRSLSRKVQDLVVGGLFHAWINALDWSWRNEIKQDSSIDSILAVMGL
jgi:hypothetical protein